MTNRPNAHAGRREGPGSWVRVAFPLAGSALAALALLSSPGAVRAATYKWVDEKGVVHYTDKVPPEDVNKGRIELNKQGVPVKKTDPAPTPEQARAKAQEEQRQKELAKQQDEQARRDKALLSSYTSESEIDLARNRSLKTIESVVQSSKAYGEQLTRRKAGLESKIKAEYAGKQIPPTIERELESINLELARQEDLLALKQKEIVAVNAKYDTDKRRWRELIAAKGGEAALLSDVNALPVMNPPPAPAPAKK